MFNYPDEATAVIGTAKATWALFWATLATFIATTAAVIAALWLPRHDRTIRHSEEAHFRGRQIASVNKDLAQTINTMWEISDRISKGIAFEPVELWRLLNRISIHNQVLQHHFDQPMPDPALLSQLATIRQGLYETRDAVKSLLPENASGGSQHYDWLKANEAAKEALTRIEGVETIVRTATTGLAAS